MIKQIIKRLIYGIVGGSTFVVMNLIIMDLTANDGLQNLFDNFTMYTLGDIVVAIGFAMGSIVFEIERLAMWLKISINAFVGFGILALGRLYFGITPVLSPAIVLLAVALFLIVAIGDYLLNGHEAKKINAKLKEQEIKENMSE